MEKEFYSRVLKLYLKYWDEMYAEMAWCAHAYATEYLADICSKAKDLLRYYLEEKPGEYEVQDALFKLGTDFDGLINKVFSSGVFEEVDRYALAYIINSAFKDRLKQAFEVLEKIYVEGTGEDFDYALEREQLKGE